MDFKKIGEYILFPHIAIRILLLPVSIVCLVLSLIYLKQDSIIAILSYLLSFYTLTIWCVQIPNIISFFRKFIEENKLINIWRNDEKVRTNITLLGTMIWNGGYAIFQLCLGIYHQTFWFISFSIYYVALAIMKFILISYTKQYEPGENMLLELKKYRTCAVMLLIMNLLLAIIVFFMVYWHRTFVQHEIVTIALAAFTFVTFTMSIIDIIKYRNVDSPIYSANKIIGFVSGLVSMLTLESTMLTTFGTSMDDATKNIFLGITGGVICILIIVLAIYMIIQSVKKESLIKQKECEENGKRTI